MIELLLTEFDSLKRLAVTGWAPASEMGESAIRILEHFQLVVVQRGFVDITELGRKVAACKTSKRGKYHIRFPDEP